MKEKVSPDSYIFRYGLPEGKTFGVGAGGHCRFHVTLNDEDLRRKFTPISEVTQKGYVDFLIKCYGKTEQYPEGGVVSQYLEASKKGDTMQMSGPWPKITYEGYGNLTLHGKTPPQVIKKTHIAGIAGGTGITPIYAIMNAGLKNKDKTNFYLVYGSRSTEDMLLKKELAQLKDDDPNHLSIQWMVDSGSKVECPGTECSEGYITEALIKKACPPPGHDVLVMYSGPPAFEALVLKCLKNLGYTGDMIFKH